jgi:hypothetical protein
LKKFVTALRTELTMASVDSTPAARSWSTRLPVEGSMYMQRHSSWPGEGGNKMAANRLEDNYETQTVLMFTNSRIP